MPTINIIIFSVLIIGGLGIVFGLILGWVGKIFNVPEDPIFPAVRDALPGANCGGCGYAGCAEFAKNVIADHSLINTCPVGGNESVSKMAEILGVEAKPMTRFAAFVRCAGYNDVADFRYDYQGLDDCNMAATLAGGGSKSCKFGCLGNGSCARICQFGAIEMKDGIAHVDNEKCTACGMCIAACPRDIIRLVPYDSKIRVACHSTDRGKEVRAHCEIGCIGCNICQKSCPAHAIALDNSTASIDYGKCTNCGLCVKKCPSKIILKF